MKALGSVQDLCLCQYWVFPFSLSPRTMKALGSVQDLCLHQYLVFPFSLSPRTMQTLGSVQDFEFTFSLSSGISRGAKQGVPGPSRKAGLGREFN